MILLYDVLYDIQQLAAHHSFLYSCVQPRPNKPPPLFGRPPSFALSRRPMLASRLYCASTSDLGVLQQRIINIVGQHRMLAALRAVRLVPSTSTPIKIQARWNHQVSKYIRHATAATAATAATVHCVHRWRAAPQHIRINQIPTALNALAVVVQH